MLRAEDVEHQPDLNFLTPAAHRHAEERISAASSENASIEVDRLRRNMLSSMPMCFNLFGAIGQEPGFLTVFQQLFDSGATSITNVVCEWAKIDPKGPAILHDRTAFDAVVFYERSDGSAFCGIETKYTEPFSQKTHKPTNKNRYREVTTESGWFVADDGAIDRLQRSASNQLWRNVMLAAAHEMAGSGRGSVAVVALDGDSGAAKAVAAVSAELTEDHADRLPSVTLESIMAAAKAGTPELAGWADRFERRYLLVDQPDDPNAAADPNGPRLGRDLTVPSR